MYILQNLRGFLLYYLVEYRLDIFKLVIKIRNELILKGFFFFEILILKKKNEECMYERIRKVFWNFFINSI